MHIGQIYKDQSEVICLFIITASLLVVGFRQNRVKVNLEQETGKNTLKYLDVKMFYFDQEKSEKIRKTIYSTFLKYLLWWVKRKKLRSNLKLEVASILLKLSCDTKI